MIRKLIMAGNWKMNGNMAKISEMCKLLKSCAPDPCGTDIVMALPFVYLQQTRKLLPESVGLAAQNCYKVCAGPFTGEMSPAMLKDVGSDWILLGHSERRQIFGECNELIGEKVGHATNEGFKVIVCVGESAEERQAKKTAQVLTTQMCAIVKNVKEWCNIVFAYEPVWAIGSGTAAKPDQAQEAHCIIRNYLAENVSKSIADSIRIQYGGSVTAKNCCDLIAQPDIDGFLVGGASMEPQFAQIIKCSGANNS